MSIPRNEHYPPANLLDRDSQVLATGTALIDTDRHLAEFFPSQGADADTLLKRGAILQRLGGASYAIQHISLCPAEALGEHYEIALVRPA